MITNSGIVVDPGMNSAPTPMDIAVGMCRITRYAGSIWCPLSVHSILAAEMVFQKTKDLRTWAYGLLHDAHEVITGEIVRAWKPKDMKDRENELDTRILPTFGLSKADFMDRALDIRYADEKALCLEATIFGLPGWRKYYVGVNGREPVEGNSWEISFANRLFKSDWIKPEEISIGSMSIKTLTEALLDIQTGCLAEARNRLSGPLIEKIPESASSGVRS